MSVIPYLTITGGRGAEAADYYRTLFDGTEIARMPAEDKKRLMHCQIGFAGGVIYLSDDFQNQPGGPAFASVFVGFDKPAAVDALAAKAQSMGATITMGPDDMFWGDRFVMFTDPFGHVWQAGAAKG